jgi:hypothetical protein
MFYQVALVRRKCNGESCRVDRSCPLYLCLYCYDALHPPMPTGVEEIDAHRLHGACSSCVSLLVPFTVHRASRLIVFNLFFVLFSQRIWIFATPPSRRFCAACATRPPAITIAETGSAKVRWTIVCMGTTLVGCTRGVTCSADPNMKRLGSLLGVVVLRFFCVFLFFDVCEYGQY